MTSWNESENYELNSTMPWTMGDDLPDNVACWILAEERCCQPITPPSVFRIMYDPQRPENTRFKYLDQRDPFNRDYLDGNQWIIVAWRRITDHGGTWDSFYKEYNITNESCWSEVNKDVGVYAS